MKKYIIILDKKINQIFQIYVNNGSVMTEDEIYKKLLKSDIDIKDTDRYITFDSDNTSIYPHHYKTRLFKERG